MTRQQAMGMAGTGSFTGFKAPLRRFRIIIYRRATMKKDIIDSHFFGVFLILRFFPQGQGHIHPFLSGNGLHSLMV
jgi:hypothetical protein